jgi:hypothetical protein
VRPRTYGPRSLTRTVTERPLARLVTRKRVPKGECPMGSRQLIRRENAGPATITHRRGTSSGTHGPPP